MKLYEKLKHIFYKNDRNSKNCDIDYQNARNMIKEDKAIILVDVRSPQEYQEGHLEGSINIPLYTIEAEEAKKLPDKKQTIILYCQSGNRSKKAVELLRKDGYQDIYHIKGGLDEI